MTLRKKRRKWADPEDKIFALKINPETFTVVLDVKIGKEKRVYCSVAYGKNLFTRS